MYELCTVLLYSYEEYYEKALKDPMCEHWEAIDCTHVNVLVYRTYGMGQWQCALLVVSGGTGGVRESARRGTSFTLWRNSHSRVRIFTAHSRHSEFRLASRVWSSARFTQAMHASRVRHDAALAGGRPLRAPPAEERQWQRPEAAAGHYMHILVYLV